MKKILLLIMCMPMMGFAQNGNGVTVENLKVEAGSPTTVTFEVSWKNTGMPALWSDTVWVFVDYNHNGAMTRLPLEAGATLTETSAPGIGRVEYPEDITNNKGVWVIGNARSEGSFSATVQLLTAESFNGACVYASNYPPVGEYTSPINISFTGTPNFEILRIHQSGATSTEKSGGDYILFPGYKIISFTDATGAPGTFHCIPPAAPTVTKGEFCYGEPGTLVASASENVIVEWYDAATGGTSLHTGEVLSLPPLYSSSAPYYVQAVLSENCRSVRTNAEYTVNNCTMSGNCPGYTAGNVDAPTTPPACAAHYAGQIGPAAVSPSCLAHDAGRIGRSR
jgi:hypothetical protein